MTWPWYLLLAVGLVVECALIAGLFALVFWLAKKLEPVFHRYNSRRPWNLSQPFWLSALEWLTVTLVVSVSGLSQALQSWAIPATGASVVTTSMLLITRRREQRKVH